MGAHPPQLFGARLRPPAVCVMGAHPPRHCWFDGESVTAPPPETEQGNAPLLLRVLGERPPRCEPLLDITLVGSMVTGCLTPPFSTNVRAPAATLTEHIPLATKGREGRAIKNVRLPSNLIIAKDSAPACILWRQLGAGAPYPNVWIFHRAAAPISIDSFSIGTTSIEILRIPITRHIPIDSVSK